MNKRIALLTLIPFALTSCGTQINNMSVDEVNAVLATYTDPGYTKYNGVGFVDALACEEDSQKVDVYGEKIEDAIYDPSQPIEKQVPLSWINGAPLHITKDNYYFETDDGVEHSSCAHYYLKECLVSIDSTGIDYFVHVDIRKNDLGGLTFKVNNEFLKLTLYFAFNGNDLEYSGRVNTEFVYDSNGYLVKEETTSTNYDAKKVRNDPTMLHSLVEYTYEV